MKHRRNKVKREHGIIQNGLPWLENLSSLVEVTDIIPGVIDVNRSSEKGIVYKYETQTGCKLLIKSNGSIQEAFVVTKHPTRVQEWVNKVFPPDPLAKTTNIKSLICSNNKPKKKMSKVPQKTEYKLENKPSAQGRHSKKHSRCKVLKSNFEEVNDALNVADRLDISTRKALKYLKKSLEDVAILCAKTKGQRNT